MKERLEQLFRDLAVSAKSDFERAVADVTAWAHKELTRLENECSATDTFVHNELDKLSVPRTLDNVTLSLKQRFESLAASYTDGLLVKKLLDKGIDEFKMPPERISASAPVLAPEPKPTPAPPPAETPQPPPVETPQPPQD